MKSSLLTSLLLTLTLIVKINDVNAQSGFIYKDALIFYNAIKSGKNPERIIDVISTYYNDPNISTVTACSTKISEDAFLSSFATRLLSVTDGAGKPEGLGASSILGLNVANYADGIAKFLIERGKEELSIAFFEKFKDDLNKYPEIKFLFPKTALIVIHIENYNMLTLLQQLRDAFIKDLTNQPTNILTLRDLKVGDCLSEDAKCKLRVPEIQKIFKPHDNYDPRPVIIALNLQQSIIDGNNIIVALNKVVNDTLICNDNDDFNSYLKFVAMLMESLRTEQVNQGLFISETQLKSLFETEDLLKIFLGLTYQKFKNNTCYSGLKINSKDLEGVLKEILNKRQNFYGMLTSLDNVNSSYQSIKKQIDAGNKVDISNVASMTSASLLLVSNTIKASNVVIGGSLPLRYDTLFMNLNIGADLCIDIQQRNYAGIFNDVIHFINTNNIIKDDKAKDNIIKYLSFASNMASASNSDEVKEAINSIALPQGSYSIKQKSACNVSLNGYIGYVWDFNGGLYAHGVYAPVGVSVSTGLGKKNGGALSFFGSLIDVGGIATYRLANGNADTLKQEVRLESILSPSLQLILGIPKWPLSVCAGWRLTPKLFYSDNKTFEVVNAINTFNVSLLIDIPVITLYNRPYR